jgi:hypothetical protein
LIYVFSLSHVCYMPCSSHPPLLSTQITFSEKYNSDVSHLPCLSRLQLLPVCQVLNTLLKCKMQFSP